MNGLRLNAVLALACLAGAVIWKSLPARTEPIEAPNPIAELFPAEIGGMTQWLLIRGVNSTAPFLTETSRFVETLGRFRAEVTGGDSR